MMNLRYLRIKTRVFIIFFIVISILSTVIFQFTRIITQEAIKGYLYNYVNISQNDIENSIDSMINQINMLAVRLLTYNNIYDVLNNKILSKNEKDKALRKLIDSQMIEGKLIGDIFIVTKDGSYYKYGNNDSIDPPDKKYLEDLDKSGVPLWGIVKKDANGNAYILSGRKYRNFYTGQDLGYMIIYIRENSLYNIYKDVVKDWGYSFIVAHNSYVISYPDKNKVGTTIFDDDIFKFDNNDEYKQANYNGNKVIITVYDMTNSLKNIGVDWKIYSIILDKKLFKNINEINIFAIIFQIAAIIISILLALKLSGSFIKPLNKLIKKLSIFGGANADVSLFKFRDKNELWALEKSFNDMVIRIEDLIKKNDEIKEREREMELTALQAQINPHFIYNTLDAIGWLAKINKQAKMEKLVIALSIFFRTSLHKGEKYITVREEIELVKSYVTIQQIRFPEKFTIEYNISEHLEDIHILKIILQPLVENAITHGISEKKGKGQIWINGCETDGDIIFEVIDDGKGFDSESNTKENVNYKGGGYGLKNVDERIKMEYGSKYGVFINSKKGFGTNATVLIRRK